MRKLHRRRCLELSVIAAALALIAAPPAGALAAAEESGGGPGETVVESPGSTESAPATSPPAATEPASPGWTSEGAGTGTSGTGASSVRHGSSVGSGGAPEKTRSTSTSPPPTTEPASTEPSYVTGSSDYEPNLSTPARVEEPAGTPPAESQIRPVEPPAPAGTGRDVELAVGAAAPLALSKSSQGRGDRSSGTHVAGVELSGPGDQAASGSYVLPLLAIVALGLLGYAGVRLHHHYRRRQLEAVKRQRADTWKAVVRQIETRRALGALEPNAERLQKIDVG
jgi:hypothetical protein